MIRLFNLIVKSPFHFIPLLQRVTYLLLHLPKYFCIIWMVLLPVISVLTASALVSCKNFVAWLLPVLFTLLCFLKLKMKHWVTFDERNTVSSKMKILINFTLEMLLTERVYLEFGPKISQMLKQFCKTLVLLSITFEYKTLKLSWKYYTSLTNVLN